MKKKFFIVGILISGCASSVPTLEPSHPLPSAQGKVESTVEQNGNTKVSVEVERLAKPELVHEGASTYVVWAQSHDEPELLQNLGALQVDEDWDGEMDAVTPLRNFDLFITAEPLATVLEPSGEKQLWTRVSAN